MKVPFLASALAVVLAGWTTPARSAITVVFNLNSLASQLTLSGNANVTNPDQGNFPFATQAPGSLTTRFSGTITAEVDSLSNPTTITFLNANISGLVNGQWQPNNAGTAMTPPGDGNFGLRAAIGDAKLRDVAFNLQGSGPAAISGGNFAQNTQIWRYSSGTFDLFSPALGAGNSQPLLAIANGTSLNNSAAVGTLTTVGFVSTLNLPVDIQLSYLIPGTPSVGGAFRYQGSLSATAVPEPSSVLLLASLVAVPCVRRFRRRRSAASLKLDNCIMA